MAIEFSAERAICSKCGTAFSSRKGNFYVSYSILHKGTGYVPICKRCVEEIYSNYLKQCNSSKSSVRQVCRALDLYWNDEIFDAIEKKASPRTLMSLYIMKTNTGAYIGKSYDDTLIEEDTLWTFGNKSGEQDLTTLRSPIRDEENENDFEIAQEIVDYWGEGYTPKMYAELEKKKANWISKFPDNTSLDAGTEAIIKQICGLELDISRDRAAGKSVDKSINALNTLLGSANMKPAQLKKDDIESSAGSTPFGVWIKRFEDYRPISEVDPELKDVDGIKKYVLTWLYGHLAKMLNIKNTHTKLYDKEIEKLRVDHPEYEDEDDDEFLYDIFKDGESQDNADTVENVGADSEVDQV